MQLCEDDCWNPAILSDTTDYLGEYSFDFVPAGTYCLRFAYPPAWFVSPQNQGDDDSLDSDVNPDTGLIEYIALDGDRPNEDMGTHASALLTGRVWCDTNGSGAYDPGEGVAGRTVDLSRDTDCDGVADAGLDTLLSGDDGTYVASGSLLPGLFVGPPGAGMPECYVLTGGDLTCPWGCCDPITPQSYTFALDADDPDHLDIDFGFRKSGYYVYLPLVVR